MTTHTRDDRATWPAGQSRCPRCHVFHSAATGRVAPSQVSGAHPRSAYMRCPHCGTTYELTDFDTHPPPASGKTAGLFGWLRRLFQGTPIDPQLWADFRQLMLACLARQMAMEIAVHSRHQGAGPKPTNNRILALATGGMAKDAEDRVLRELAKMGYSISTPLYRKLARRMQREVKENSHTKQQLEELAMGELSKTRHP